MEESVRLPGSRLSISNIERVIPIYQQYKEDEKITHPEIKSQEKEIIEEKAYHSFQGTQIHNLVEHLYLFQKRQKLNSNSYPNYQDIKDTFPSYGENECQAYSVLYERYKNPIDVWEQSTLNSEIPKEKKLSTVLDPAIIMNIWKSALRNIDAKTVINNLEERRADQMEMNEVLTILNLQFDRNLQITSSVDTLIIPLEYNKPHMTIIDYKTGIEMEEITYISKLQAMLMSISIYYNFIDKIVKDKIVSRVSTWEIAHPEKPIQLPHFTRKALSNPKRFNKSVDIDTVYSDLGRISKRVDFLYFNPLTKETKKVNYLPIARKGLLHLNDLNEFYFFNKERLKRAKTYNYLTPTFVPEKILDPESYNTNSSYKGTQIAFF